ncbi:MAG: hypothetical protein SGI99_12055 [Pseudomonadota bacterium]|nr:hypothetical protein [Pseudomonadota bacterium]
MAHSKLALCGAIGGNVGMAVTKFTVAGITGSSATLQEGVQFASVLSGLPTQTHARRAADEDRHVARQWLGHQQNRRQNALATQLGGPANRRK